MLHIIPLLAQASAKANNISWALILFCVILGLLVTLSASRRTYEIKRSKDE
jgi:hypothetical protein